MSANPTFDPQPGVPDFLAPGLRRILAPNPSPMTFRGTNTYLLGDTEIAVIDPGPLNEDHLEAILRALLPSQKVTHIVVSHAHCDHSPLARVLAARTGAPVYGFGPATAGRSETMQALAETGLVGGGEGVDLDFSPDLHVADGDVLTGEGWELRAIHTPGHMGNHLCFALGDICFTADLVMGWATSLVSPPDGDLTDFMASCARLQRTSWRRFYPGHGAPIDAPHARLDALIAHRQSRERAVLAALDTRAATVEEITGLVYTDTPPALLPAAARNVLAHLIDLRGRALVDSVGDIGANAVYRQQ